MNFHCDIIQCDHNTCLTKECMFGLTKHLVNHVKDGKPMCEHLRKKVLESLEVLERLEIEVPKNE